MQGTVIRIESAVVDSSSHFLLLYYMWYVIDGITLQTLQTVMNDQKPRNANELSKVKAHFKKNIGKAPMALVQS